MASNDMEHAALIDLIGKAMSAKGADPVDVMRTYSAHITRVRDDAVAAELDDQSATLWDAATILESTYEVLSANGDDQAAAILQGQVKVLRDASSRISRRAATVRGISAEELAARALLTIPHDGQTAPTFEPVDGFEVKHHQGWAITCVKCGTREIVEGTPADVVTAWRDQHTCPPKEELPAD